MTSPLQELNVILRGDASQLIAALNSAQKAVRGVASQMKAMGGRGIAAGFTRATQDMAKATHHLAAQATHAGYVLTHAISKPIMDAGTEAVHLANDFELSMSRIEGLTSTPQKQVVQFTEAIKEIGPALGKSPQELAEGMYFIASGGLRGEAAIKALTATAKASVAGLGEVKDIAFAAKASVNAYASTNMTAARATDILTAAVTEGKVNAAQLAPVMGRILPIASAMGVSFEDVAGSMASLTRVGATAAQASVGIQAMLMTLAKPSMAARELVEGAGLSFQQLRDMAKESGGIIKVMRTLDATFGEDEEAIARIVPNIRALRAALGILAQKTATVDEVMRNVRNSVGATDRAFAVAARTNAVKFQMALQDLNVLLIEVGKSIADTLSPVFAELAAMAKGAAEWFRSLSPAMKGVLLVAGALAAALAPAVFALATFSALISFVWPVIAGAIGAVMALGSAFWGLIGSILTLKIFFVGIPAILGAIWAGIVALVPATIAFVTGLALIAAPLAVAAALVTGLVRRAGGLEAAWKKVKEAAVRTWDWLYPTRRALAEFWATTTRIAMLAWQSLENFVLSVWDDITGGISWDDIQKGAVTAIQAVEFGLLRMGDVSQLTTTAIQYAFVAMGNEIEHFFTQTLPYAAGWGLRKLAELVLAASYYVGKQIHAAAEDIKGRFMTAMMTGDWQAAFSPMMKAAGGSLKLVKDAMGGDGVAIMQLLTGRLEDKGEDKGVLKAIEAVRDGAKAAAEEAVKADKAFKKALVFGGDFELPLRQEGKNERALREQMRGQWERLQNDFSEFKWRRDQESAWDELLDIYFRQTMPFAGMWGEAQDDFAVAGQMLGETLGQNMARGLGKEAKSFDTALRGTLQDALHWQEYYESTLKPIEEARLARQEKLRQQSLEQTRLQRATAHLVTQAVMGQLQEMAELPYALMRGGPEAAGRAGPARMPIDWGASPEELARRIDEAALHRAASGSGAASGPGKAGGHRLFDAARLAEMAEQRRVLGMIAKGDADLAAKGLPDALRPDERAALTRFARELEASEVMVPDAPRPAGRGGAEGRGGAAGAGLAFGGEASADEILTQLKKLVEIAERNSRKGAVDLLDAKLKGP